ncbi:MAG: PilZ domain-containing protein [Pseudomonadota bacterium]
MSDPSHLSQDERDFIQQLLISPVNGKSAQAPSFRVDGGEQANTLLRRLGANANLSLESQFDDYSMTFPLQLVEDEFHTLHLKLGAPSIFESGPVLRPWRLQLDQPIALLDAQGQPSFLSVQELSPNGLLISSIGKAPLQFELWLPLPDHEPIRLHGKRVRSVGKQLTAYTVEMDHEGRQDSERIRHFIFQQHRLQYPQLCPS